MTDRLQLSRVPLAIVTAGLAGLFAVASPPSCAGSVSAVMQVRATVVASCVLQTEPLVFRDYAADSAVLTTPAHAGVIALRCTRDTPAVVYMRGDQRMAGPGESSLAYRLTADDGSEWTDAHGVTVMGQGPAMIRLQVGGSIPRGQRVPPGAYVGEQMVEVVY